MYYTLAMEPQEETPVFVREGPGDVDRELQAAAVKALAHYEIVLDQVRADMARLRELDREYSTKILALRSLHLPDGNVTTVTASGTQDSMATLDCAMTGALAGASSADRASQVVIWSAAEAALRGAGTLHYTALADALAPHVTIRGRNPAATLLTYLSRKPELFVRIDRGTYALKDATTSPMAAPGKPKKRSRKAARRRRRKRSA